MVQIIYYSAFLIYINDLGVPRNNSMLVNTHFDQFRTNPVYTHTHHYYSIYYSGKFNEIKGLTP